MKLAEQTKYNKQRNYEILKPLWKEWSNTRKGAFRNYMNWENFVLEDNFEKTATVLGLGAWNKHLPTGSEDVFNWYQENIGILGLSFR